MLPPLLLLVAVPMIAGYVPWKPANGTGSCDALPQFEKFKALQFDDNAPMVPLCGDAYPCAVCDVCHAVPYCTGERPEVEIIDQPCGDGGCIKLCCDKGCNKKLLWLYFCQQ